MILYKDAKQVKNLLKYRLAENGLTLRQAANAAGLTPQGLNDRFLRKDLSIDELQRICTASGLCVLVDIVAIHQDATSATN